jgi:hypothetical protein
VNVEIHIFLASAIAGDELASRVGRHILWYHWIRWWVGPHGRCGLRRGRKRFEPTGTRTRTLQSSSQWPVYSTYVFNVVWQQIIYSSVDCDTCRFKAWVPLSCSTNSAMLGTCSHNKLMLTLCMGDIIHNI